MQQQQPLFRSDCRRAASVPLHERGCALPECRNAGQVPVHVKESTERRGTNREARQPSCRHEQPRPRRSGERQLRSHRPRAPPMALLSAPGGLLLFLVSLPLASARIDPHACPAPFSCVTVFGTVQSPAPSTLCGLGFSVPPCADGVDKALPLCNRTTFDCEDTGRVACPPYTPDNDTVVCIQPTQMCDGVEDCFGGTDESIALCSRGSPGAFNCSSVGKTWCPSNIGCIPEYGICAGYSPPKPFLGCADGSDESPAFCAKYTCPAVLPFYPDRIKCPRIRHIRNSFQCIHASDLCDGTPNCVHGQDDNVHFCTRFDCASIGKRKCPGGVGCITESQMCNGNVDCTLPQTLPNVTDETLSVCQEYNCSSTGGVKCPDGSQCLNSESQLCNGVPDCPPHDWANMTLSSDESPEFCATVDCASTDRAKCPGPSSIGQCIGPQSLCDGIPDCPDSSDEDPVFCKTYDCYSSGRGQCLTGPPYCIPLEAMCNNVTDCSDGSDESPGICMSFNCSLDGRVGCPSHIQCLNSPAALCDGIIDCPDGSDEATYFCKDFQCSATNRTLCPSRVGCLPFGTQCDGARDCRDGSDEGLHFCRHLSCQSQGAFKCPRKKRQCIEPSRVCDGFVDCLDGSDESYKLCNTLSCGMYDKVKCPYFSGSPGRCIYEYDFCNGVPDCPGGLDEEPYFDCQNFTCPIGHIKCSTNNTCTPGIMCNGLPEDCDCSPGRNAFDEDPATCLAYQCPTGFVKCKDMLQCINETALCNSIQDCIDGSDEDTQLCSTFNCSPDQRVTCPGGRGWCMSSTCALCDGFKDCPMVTGKYNADGSTYYPDEDPAFCSLRGPTCPLIGQVATS